MVAAKIKINYISAIRCHQVKIVNEITNKNGLFDTFHRY